MRGSLAEVKGYEAPPQPDMRKRLLLTHHISEAILSDLFFRRLGGRLHEDHVEFGVYTA